jgi:hypothetical protein
VGDSHNADPPTTRMGAAEGLLERHRRKWAFHFRRRSGWHGCPDATGWPRIRREQAGQALRNIVAVLKQGGAGPEHLVRLTWYVTDMRAYLTSLKELGRVYREVIGNHYPVMALVGVTALVFADAKVEIEATAVVPLP